ncbi:MAG: S8 family serine peptidase, partial [Candidatus Eisenbacteria bacterium]|nr:S8 family serine peptidase [Candidatus Eisenbacteria bacterium]
MRPFHSTSRLGTTRVVGTTRTVGTTAVIASIAVVVALSIQPAAILAEETSPVGRTGSALSPQLQTLLRAGDAGAIQAFLSEPAGETTKDGRIPCFIRRQAEHVAWESLGLDVETDAGRIATARLSMHEIDQLATRPGVACISMAVPTRPLLDTSIPEISADLVHDSNGLIPPTYSGLTGDGVIIGIVDTGVDPYHGDFSDAGATRILNIWDQTDNSGTPPAGYTYGTEWEAADIDGATCTADDPNGHGTHVAGIAAGNGAATGNGEPPFTFVGVAPEADIIFVKTTFLTTDVTDAVQYIFDRAAAVGRPAVVNLSLGTHFGAHDGTSEFDVALNALAGEEKIVVAAAGNEHGDGVHAEVIVSEGATDEMTFEIPPYSPHGMGNNDLVAIDGWYTGGAEVTVTITSPNGHVTGPTAFSAYSGNSTPDGYVEIYNGTTAPANGDENLYILIRDAIASSPPEAGTWTIELEAVSVPAKVSPPGAEVDAWIFNYTMSNSPHFVIGVEEEEIVGSPASADSVLAVSAYVTKTSWPSVDGNNYQYNPAPTLGDIATFSSVGPRRDDVLKPDIAAPGMGIAAAHSQDAPNALPYILPDGVHIINQGTSMASPHIAGVVALMLELVGSLSKAEILEQFGNTARTDGYTSAVPNSVWGYGKIDALGAVSYGTPVSIYAFDARALDWGVELIWS